MEVARFSPGDADLAEVDGGDRGYGLGENGRFAAAEEGDEAVVDALGCFGGELLVEDGSRQGEERRAG